MYYIPGTRYILLRLLYHVFSRSNIYVGHKTGTNDQLLRAPVSWARIETDIDKYVGEERKGWNLLATKMQGTNRSGDRTGEKSLPRDHRSELRLQRREREKKKGEDN